MSVVFSLCCSAFCRPLDSRTLHGRHFLPARFDSTLIDPSTPGPIQPVNPSIPVSRPDWLTLRLPVRFNPVWLTPQLPVRFNHGRPLDSRSDSTLLTPRLPTRFNLWLTLRLPVYSSANFERLVAVLFVSNGSIMRRIHSQEGLLRIPHNNHFLI